MLKKSSVTYERLIVESQRFSVGNKTVRIKEPGGIYFPPPPVSPGYYCDGKCISDTKLNISVQYNLNPGKYFFQAGGEYIQLLYVIIPYEDSTDKDPEMELLCVEPTQDLPSKKSSNDDDNLEMRSVESTQNLPLKKSSNDDDNLDLRSVESTHDLQLKNSLNEEDIFDLRSVESTQDSQLKNSLNEEDIFDLRSVEST